MSSEFSRTLHSCLTALGDDTETLVRNPRRTIVPTMPSVSSIDQTTEG